MNDWHLPPAVLSAYAEGRTDTPVSWSVEAHLADCDLCRQALPPANTAVDLDAVWNEIVDVVDRPDPRPVESALRRVGLSEPVARLLGATPSLSLSWFAGVAVVLGSAVLAAGLREQSVGLFLVLAPLVPVAGIAAAYGPGLDPAYEVAVAAPMRGIRLLLVRAVAVLIGSFVVSLVASAFLPGAATTVLAWVLPAFALSASTLALGTYIEPIRAAIGLGFGWLALTIVTVQRTHDLMSLFQPSGQLFAATVAVVAVAIVAIRAARRVEVNHLDPSRRQSERTTFRRRT